MSTIELSIDKSSQRLSPKEVQLLQILCEHTNQVTPREKALISILKEDCYFTTRSMDVYINKLRKYLQKENNISIENIHSSGYALQMRS